MSTRIEDVADRNRLELYDADTRIGLLQYRRARDLLIIEHTEVDSDRQGHGYAGELVKTALDQAMGERRRVIVTCPYAQAWLQRHPEYANLDHTHDQADQSEDLGQSDRHPPQRVPEQP